MPIMVHDLATYNYVYLFIEVSSRFDLLDVICAQSMPY